MAKPDLITRDHRARLVSSKRDLFAYYTNISHILYTCTHGRRQCLLGFWPLGQNPAGAIMLILFFALLYGTGSGRFPADKTMTSHQIE